jgi:hypothetical protein
MKQNSKAPWKNCQNKIICNGQKNDLKYTFVIENE